MIKRKAQDLAKQLNIASFCGSNGWLDGFKKRNGVVFNKICEDIISAVSTENEEKEEEARTNKQEVDKVTKGEAEKALKTLHKYFEQSSVGDKAIFDKLYFIEKSLEENNLRQTKITEFFHSYFLCD